MKARPTSIAFISNTSWSLYNFRIEVIRSFIAKGVEVYLCAPKDAYSSKLIAEGAIFLPIALSSYGTNPIKDLLLFIRLLRLYRKYRFDHIFHYTIKPNIYGSLAARLSGTPSTAITTGLGRLRDIKNPIISTIARTLYKISVSGSKEVWFLNSHDQELFISQGIVSRAKTFLLPSEGINTKKFKPNISARNSPITRFLFAGRLLKDKGVVEFVRAAESLRPSVPKLRFEILGFIDENNPNSVSSEDLLRWQKSGMIKYLGSSEDVRGYIYRADCIVFPSYYGEGVSRILLEAASMSKPIITTSNVGCKEIVLDGVSGIICKPRSVSDLIKAIRSFLSLATEERVQMGQAGRSWVKTNYCMDRIISIYHSKLKEYCSPPELDTISNYSISTTKKTQS